MLAAFCAVGRRAARDRRGPRLRDRDARVARQRLGLRHAVRRPRRAARQHLHAHGADRRPVRRPVALVNATFDAGDKLPVAGQPAQRRTTTTTRTSATPTHDKAWQVAAPGRASLAAAANGQPVDVVRINAGDEPWMDLARQPQRGRARHDRARRSRASSRSSTAASATAARARTSTSRRSSGESIVRIQRPEAKAALHGRPLHALQVIAVSKAAGASFRER